MSLDHPLLQSVNDFLDSGVTFDRLSFMRAKIAAISDRQVLNFLSFGMRVPHVQSCHSSSQICLTPVNSFLCNLKWTRCETTLFYREYNLMNRAKHNVVFGMHMGALTEEQILSFTRPVTLNILKDDLSCWTGTKEEVSNNFLSEIVRWEVSLASKSSRNTI